MSRLSEVNTTDIPGAIALGCRTMCSVFNADDHDIPFFASQVLPDAYLDFNSSHSEAHVPGRHLNALLSAEDAVGVRIDEGCIQKHTAAAFFSYGGPVPLPLNREKAGGRPNRLIVHNIREGFHALYALTRYRGDERARRLAEESVTVILRHWHPGRGWDVSYLESLGLVVVTGNFITGIARSMGPLVKYYRCTGYGPALELALLLKEKAVGEFYTGDGGFDTGLFGTHTHSVTCVMSSLAQLADLLSDMSLLERVRKFYDNGLWQLRDGLGWSVENAGPGANPDRGEVNNTGDIVETALILGKWGYPEYYHDAERILRGHLLPSQLRDISFIRDPDNPGGLDGRRDVARRHRGAFGFPAPYGHQPVGCADVSFNMDIVGGSVASLCEAYREAVSFREGIHRVNLLFDHETPAVRVESPYTHDALSVTVRKPGPLLVRIPSWVDDGELTVAGAAAAAGRFGGYLYIPQPRINRPIVIGFPLKEQQMVLHHRTSDIRVRLRGDEVTAMDSPGAGLTFFDPMERE